MYHGEYTLQETVILTQLNLNMQARDLERMYSRQYAETVSVQDRCYQSRGLVLSITERAGTVLDYFYELCIFLV